MSCCSSFCREHKPRLSQHQKSRIVWLKPLLSLLFRSFLSLISSVWSRIQMWSRCICCYNLHYRLTKLMTITDTSKIFRCSSQDPALITFKGTVLFNILIFGTKWNLSQLISAKEIVFLPHHVFMGAQWVGTASYSRDTVSPRVISVVVDSQSSYSWFSDLLLILRTPHQLSTPILAVVLAL